MTPAGAISFTGATPPIPTSSGSSPQNGTISVQIPSTISSKATSTKTTTAGSSSSAPRSLYCTGMLYWTIFIIAATFGSLLVSG